MKNLNKNKIIMILSFVLFFIVLLLYLTKTIYYIDETVYKTIISFENPILTTIMKIITFFGGVEFIFIIIFILLILSFFKGHTSIIFI